MESIGKELLKVAQAVALLLLFSSIAITTATAQESAPSLQTVLTRYAGATRTSPTTDEELARRLFRRGNTYSNLERHEEAIEEFEQCIAADPNFAEGYRNLANT
ncbi:MAG: tetratricopeptide repeat protein, partial [Gammaproteobacteria bacterium]|nr:tetratricopeptide repeat protein [Gammaproteobacteria bacterium]